MTLTGLLEQPEPGPRPIVVRFHTPGPLHVLESSPRSVVIALSFSATLLLVSLLIRLL
jgi:hypothetical protein